MPHFRTKREITFHRLAASAAEAAENLENPSANEIAVWADETMKVRDGGKTDGPVLKFRPIRTDIVSLNPPLHEAVTKTIATRPVQLRSNPKGDGGPILRNRQDE